MADQVLERFHRALIEEIQTQRPEYLTQPFTVAEIYQNLVPYGSHRDRIGVEMNGDYEDALVRLLAGEGGYLILDSEAALEKLRSELDATNPNTGVYREYAAVDVRLNQAYLDLSAEAMDQLPDLVEELEAEDPMTITDLAPAEGNASADDPAGAAPGGDIFADYVTEEAEPESRSSGRPPLAPEYVDEPEQNGAPSAGATDRAHAGAVDGSCVWCRADLPEREDVNYCPFCGTDLRLVPCASCGAEIEPGWVFCAACGTEVDA